MPNEPNHTHRIQLSGFIRQTVECMELHVPGYSQLCVLCVHSKICHQPPTSPLCSIHKTSIISWVRIAGAAASASKPRLPSPLPRLPAPLDGIPRQSQADQQGLHRDGNAWNPQPVMRPNQMPKQRLSCDLLLDVQAPLPLSKGEPSYPPEENNFGQLYSRSCSLGHDPKFMTMGEELI